MTKKKFDPQEKHLSDETANFETFKAFFNYLKGSQGHEK